MLLRLTVPRLSGHSGQDTQAYKSPEEIRKANLRGADLGGANIAGVDFYLVDLRDAKYSSDQAEQLRRCGAILFHRAAN